MPIVGTIDLYYLHVRKRYAIFSGGAGTKQRHSAGVRISKEEVHGGMMARRCIKVDD